MTKLDFEVFYQTELKFAVAVQAYCWLTVDVAAASDNDNDDDNDDGSEDGMLFVSLRAHRALINVWIPSVFLQGRAANAYHVYQVHSATVIFLCLSRVLWLPGKTRKYSHQKRTYCSQTNGHMYAVAICGITSQEDKEAEENEE